MEIAVREATWADGAAVRDVHVASIEGLGVRGYDAEQVAAWAGGLQPDDYAIDARETYFVVAERGDRLVGFGTLTNEPGDHFRKPVGAEVTAVYVRPAVARRGVGSRLYGALESHARDEGVDSLGLWASRHAVPFYEAHGYERVSERVHEFGDGVEGTVVEMHKALGP